MATDLGGPREGEWGKMIVDEEMSEVDLSCMDLLTLGVLGLKAGAGALWFRTETDEWRSCSYGLVPQSDSRSTLDFEHCQMHAELSDSTFVDQIAQLLKGDDASLVLRDFAQMFPDSPFVQPPFWMRWAYCVSLGDTESPQRAVLMVMDRWEHQITKDLYRAVAAMGRSLLRALQTELDGASGPVRTFDRTSAPAAGDSNAPLERERLDSPVLKSTDVAKLFDVSPRTVDNWATSGKLPHLRTLGGHFRFRTEEMLELLNS